MRLFKKIINLVAICVITISAISIVLSVKTDNFATNYTTQIVIILGALGIISFEHYTKCKWLRNQHYVLNYKTFVDRKKQIKELLDILKKGNNIINIFGIDGIGVSETLRFSADLINKKIPIGKRLKYYKSPVTLLPSKNIAFYLKVTNINSKEQLIKELYENMFISERKENLSLAELISFINKKSGRKRIILMFDEIQNNLQIALVEEFILSYLRFRPQDTFFVGSHQKNLSYQLTYRFIEILKFDKKELFILAKAYNVRLKEDESTKLFELSQGIPIYAYLLLRYYNIEKQLCKDNLIDYLHNEILNLLNLREKEIISKIALMSKQYDEINYDHLSRAISDFSLSELQSLENKAIVQINPKNKTVSILPIVADQVLLHFNDKAFARKLYIFHKQKHNDSLAIMYLLLSDIEKKDVNYFHKVIDCFLEKNDMLSLYYSFRVCVDLDIDIFQKCSFIYKKYCFSCITMLLSCGKYKQAENIFKAFTFNTSYFLTLKAPLSEEQFEFYFLWADTKHLLNCYSEAINILDELIQCENSNEYILCQLYWMKAHCLRHQWKDFVESLHYYNLCNELSQKQNRTEYIIRSIHGMICISFITFDENFDYKNKFNELETIYEETGDRWNLYKYNTLKYKSIFERINHKNLVVAESLLNQSLEGYQKVKRRNIYDVYFEFGELYRFGGEYRKAIEFYTKCLDFAQNNSDYNLQSLAQLGIILCRINIEEKISKSSLIEELQMISLIAESKELFLNKFYSKIILEGLDNIDYTGNEILLFNP